MIGAVDDDGAVRQASFLKFIENPADLGVHVGDAVMVAGHILADFWQIGEELSSPGIQRMLGFSCAKSRASVSKSNQNFIGGYHTRGRGKNFMGRCQVQWVVRLAGGRGGAGRDAPTTA